MVGVWSLRTCHLRVESAHANQHIKRQRKIDQKSKDGSWVSPSVVLSIPSFRVHVAMAVEQAQDSGIRGSAVWPPTSEKVCPIACELRPKRAMRCCSASVKEGMPTSTTACLTPMRAADAKAPRLTWTGYPNLAHVVKRHEEPSSECTRPVGVLTIEKANQRSTPATSINSAAGSINALQKADGSDNSATKQVKTRSPTAA